mmetsp:Transcript_2592/g.7802  ORF Transcript_2592/g.7802 Transcript_2592/m.7802 type:complete len:164 (-) Transcript_2592:52-543(-)|eukprot:CAMPEP_0198727490 /NCGR_PEP_ID=MMETSP1475-20131203/4273_1 /TAXON_ID= ORGANISM="Unidentified sp., Strain CCMP1999" /NCGR_SAMPLE_ID=MMETSP1475 /ASSEMBLY_ACC=CAM_ASM_001111 /LENGTH=163 /DNA_ID=CAMNT_0044489537 /DNA_START=132 /DNA_END=623 /DNA_ORIENTATION=-
MAFLTGVSVGVGGRCWTRNDATSRRNGSGAQVMGRRGVACAALEVEQHVPAEAAKNFLEVTPTAAKQLHALKAQNEKTCLRIGVRQGGCSGMSYFMEFEDESNVGKIDEVNEIEGMKVVCDMKSLMYMFGMTLDFSTDLVGGGFKFFNPKATSTCGCGQSFGV